MSFQELEQRFWTNVRICDHGVECAECCWPWLGTLSLGYGVFSIYDKERYAQTGLGVRNIRANRLACEIATRAPIPSGLFALHKCNMPACCHYHPQHVYLGTPQDNTRDMLDAGRHISQTKPESICRGANHWMHLYPEKALRHNQQRRTTKLRPCDVLMICHLSRAGFPLPTLMHIFAVSREHVREIVAGKRWKLYTSTSER